jgi:hypothetical protein
MLKRSIIPGIAACCLCSLAAHGSDFSRYELYGAYSFMRVENHEDSVIVHPFPNVFSVSLSDKPDQPNLQGFKAGGAVTISRYLGITGEFGWNRSRKPLYQTSLNVQNAPCNPDNCLISQTNTTTRNEQSGERFTLLGGPRLSMNLAKRLRPFAQVQIGWERNGSSIDQRFNILQNWSWLIGPVTENYDTAVTLAPEHSNSFAVAAGGGVDLKINERFSLRLFEIDVVNAREPARQFTANTKELRSFANGSSTTFSQSDTALGHADNKWMHNTRFSFGAVFHFGNK